MNKKINKKAKNHQMNDYWIHGYHACAAALNNTNRQKNLLIMTKEVSEKLSTIFNIKDFDYAKCSTCTDKLGLETYANTNGFFSEYSQSTSSEDMAEVFSHLMIGIDKVKVDPILKKKIEFIKNNLFKIDKNFIL